MAMLGSGRQTLEPPIRAELFGAERFRLHGASLGKAQVAHRRPRRSTAFFPRLHDNIAVLREAYRYVDTQAMGGHAVSPAGEWLLDNFHLVAEQFKAVHDGLPRQYFRDLPVLADAHLAGLPRVYGIAWAFVAHTDSLFDEHLLAEFVEAYQQSRDLTLGEMWALPTTLRVVLVENLRRLCERMAATDAAREFANGWCDRPDAVLGSALRADNEGVFRRMQARGVGRAFALQVMQRLHSDPGATTAAGASGREALRATLALALPDPAAAQALQSAEEAADNLSVSHAITSLRLIGQVDWRGLVAQTSALVRLLNQVPSFRAEHETTQDTSLHAIERLARVSDRSELAVADVVLRLMQDVDGVPEADAAALAYRAEHLADSPMQTLGHWLSGAGLDTLRANLGLRPGHGLARTPGWRRATLAAYLAAMALGTAGLTHWFITHHGAGTATGVLSLLAILLVLWPASEAVIAVVNRLVSESVPPRGLPRLALPDGIPPQHHVLVVVPAMLTSQAGVRSLVAQLERHHLANVERHAQFALLSDYADAAAQFTPGDLPLLAQALSGVDALEARYPSGAPIDAAHGPAPRRFLLLHRDRQWSDSEQRWIGWERKRGKLEQLVSLLAGGSHHAFIDLGAASRPSVGTPYIVTLDSDTVMPPGALRALVGVAAHPLNRPQLDEGGQRVVSGYGILQPRIAAPLAIPGDGTPFHWLFAGAGGLDPYSAASSEVHQDLFGTGTFTGKGLLQVAAVHASLCGRLPESQVLSHDLLEGAMARCGGVSDILLIEEAPMHADVAASRLHRWTRGDWQLLPLLRNAGRHGIGATDRWKMLDNLRRSLVAPCSAALLVWSLAGGALSPWAALALVALALGGGSMMGALAGLVPHRENLALRHFYGLALSEVGRALGGTLWRIALLLENAMAMLDAVSRALWRMAVSHRGLLQWTTAAAAQAAASHSLVTLARRHARVSSVALALMAALLAAGTPAPGLAVALCALWAATPLWIWWASRVQPRADAEVLSTADQHYLMGVARDTWQLFEQHVNADSHHLPPDNVQTMPTTMVAQRTSPTNIGLYLLSLACAEQFGWITADEWLARADRTLDTLESLPRHRGHVLNWIDTHTLATLLPAYVSTVDSGNLCGHLVTVAGACRERIARATAQDPADLAPRLSALAARCLRLAEEPEFGFLLHPTRRLFHIGFRVDDQRLDPAFYDLLASEARLASLWAIAKGDVPVSHWAALGRPFFAVGGLAGLRSWSGSMFEYLMPSLVLDEPPGSVLDGAARSAVLEQIAYGQARGVPWGISECAYAEVDHTLAYQYAPQGVPRLAMRRTPPDELVVAPYATMLAAMFQPQQAVVNLRALEALQARGADGFVEALDCSSARQTNGGRGTLVYTFMAHHQGMTIVALANVLLQGAPRRWAMSDPRLAAMSPLLQERVPRALSRLFDPLPVPNRIDHGSPTPDAQRAMQPATVGLPPTQLLSNGRYSVSLRPNGAGWSRLGSTDISRWRDDAPRDAHGSFVYLRLPGLAAPVSITQHPAPDPSAQYQCSFESGRVCFEAGWPDLRTRCTVWVNPEDDVELRRIELWNTSSRPLQIELMSVFEVALSEARADETHPAFTNLFVLAEWDPAERAILLERRPRLSTETGLHAAHFIARSGLGLGTVRAQTDRARWQGRNRDASDPLAELASGLDDDPGRGTGLDPVAAIGMQLTLPAHGVVELTLGTAVAADAKAVRDLVQRHRVPELLDRSLRLAATHNGLRLSEMRISADTLQAIRTLTTALALVMPRPMPDDAGPDDGSPCDRRSLWRFGLSGDRPLIVVGIGAASGLALVSRLVRALRWWSWGGLPCDLVVLNAEPRSYLTPLQSELEALAERHRADQSDTTGAGARLPCGLVLLHQEDLSALESATLTQHARVRLQADGRPLSDQVLGLAAWHDAALARREQAMPQPLATRRSGAPGRVPGRAPGQAAQAWSGGRFDGTVRGAYQFKVDHHHRPARPWVNVMANAGFGGLLSEAGSGCSWAGNSRLNQLTPWSNDPVGDPSGESFLLQDLDSGEVWNLGAGEGCSNIGYEVQHEPGVSTIRHRRGPLAVQATWCVDPVSALKQVRIVLRNLGTETLRLRAIGMVDWVMGAERGDRRSVRTGLATMQTSRDGHGQPVRVDALVATQSDGHAGFGGGTAFLALRSAGAGDGRLEDWTCDRREFFGSDGRRAVPLRFGQQAGAGLDPGAAASARLRLADGQIAEATFYIGHGATAASARDAAAAAAVSDPVQREAAVRAHWAGLLDAVTVHTPDPLFDVLVNRWLLYQTIACRLWGRAAFYQAGGAFGFRDQLQDAMAVCTGTPALLRGQLLLAASRQFVEGDVQHWWHPPGGAGVRTHMSDDLLWLPHAAAHYTTVSGDHAVLDEPVAFLDGDPVPPDREDAYFTPPASTQQATLYEHCARAIDHSLRVGGHGLPLMGTGDWNDGMNRVGHAGRGESVWLGFFLCQVVADFAPLAESRGDGERALRWEAAANAWRGALRTTAWDGEWFIRAFFDDGSPLGSHANAECRIDLIAQAWSVLSGVGTPEQQRTAMDSARRLLVDEANGLVRLLDPPLVHATPSAGYIQAYPPGVRENGGQYNHAGVWALMAQARLGDGDAAYQTFKDLSPAHRSAHPVQGPAYGLEPYAMAADVYTQAPFVGRGGWSWYTGSAGWLHRAAIESICGMAVRGGSVRFTPCLPGHWPMVSLVLQRGGRTHDFTVCADWAVAEIASVRARGVAELRVGDWLALERTAEPSRHLVVVNMTARRPWKAPAAALLA
jgi:cyclic beta-1,2-glucan synthetase